MGETLQEYGPIQDDYAFFQAHATEAEQDLRAYAAEVAGLAIGRGPLRLLDFGCGDGTFTAAFLTRLRFPRDRLRVALVEPDEGYRQSAADRTRPFTTQPVLAHPSLPSGSESAFDLVLSNHALYYVPDLGVTVAALVQALAPGGLLVTAMAGRRNAWIQFWDQCFTLLGQPVPYHTAEDLEAALAERGVGYRKSDVWYELAFPDAEENRLKICRFLLGKHFPEVPRGPMLALFDQFANAGAIRVSVVHEHFAIQKGGSST